MASANKHHNITVQISMEFEGLDIDTTRLRKLVKAVCSRSKLSKATVSIAIVNDVEICRVNKEFLGNNSTTDCLSFDLSDEVATGAEHRDRKGQQKKTARTGCSCAKLFELVVNGEMAAKEARLRGHPGEAELALYVTHGLLHNLGFDDSTHAQAKKMHDAEDEILQQFGYGLIYNKGKRA